jgi:peptidoglycan/LPS O-acetylase OafA/YrhL
MGHGVAERTPPAESAKQGEAAARTRHAHLAYVDGLRALAALYVVLDHARLEVWNSDAGHGAPHGLAALTNWSTYGEFAVAFFIVISGFCLMLPVVRNGGTLRGGAVQFIRRRARRILPPFYAAALLSLLLIWALIGTKTGTHWDVSVPVTTTGYLANLLLVQDVLGKAQINHAFWSIALEWQIYFLFPLLLLFWRRIGVLRAAAIALAVSYAAYVAVHVIGPVGAFDPRGFRPEFAGLFVLGMLGATIAFEQRPVWERARRLPWTPIACVCGAASVAATVAAGAHASHVIGFLNLPVGLTAVSLLVAGARTEGRNAVRAVLGARQLALLGAFSYSLYLVHAPLLQVEWQYLVHPLGLTPAATYGVLLVLGVPAIVAFTYLFFLVCERPFMSARQKRASEGEFAEAARPAPGPTVLEPVTADALGPA